MDEAVLQISGEGHWFMEGWIGNHLVDFLVDSGSAVTGLSCSFYHTLVRAGASVGALRITPRKLRGANGLSINILGCSSCVVSFLGLQTEFPIIVCDLSTYAIIGTDTLGSVLPHTLNIKNGLLFTELHLMDAILSRRVFTMGQCFIPPYSEAVLHCTTRTVGGWSSLVVLVSKKDGGTRFCVDYRRLNLATVKDAYPLPCIDDTLDMLAGKRWFSTPDLASGYWQASLSPEARCKTAFATHSGFFQFKVMLFGLCNAPATFAWLMDRVLEGLCWFRCIVYLDDIISFGTTFHDSLDNLTLIFKRLRAYGLQLKSTKCHLFWMLVPFLGHGRRGLEYDPKKIEDIKSCHIPDCLRSVRQFLGFVGYYRRLVHSFADLAEPLVALTGKDVPFVWRLASTTAFVSLQGALVRAPALAFPTETGSYILDTDASNFGLGGVLSQIQNDVECVIAYCSCTLRPSQRKYWTTKREMLAAVSMCIQFRSYLCGAKFTLHTDHNSLVWLHRFKDTEGMMACWLHIIQQFQFSIVHRAGGDHGNADGLSRVPTYPCGQCVRVDCPPVDTAIEVVDQPFDAESVGDLEDADLVPLQSGDEWVAPVRTFALLPFNFRILRASHYWRGSGRMLFPLGRRLRVCARSCTCCGIIGIIFRQT